VIKNKLIFVYKIEFRNTHVNFGVDFIVKGC